MLLVAMVALDGGGGGNTGGSGNGVSDAGSCDADNTFLTTTPSPPNTSPHYHNHPR